MLPWKKLYLLQIVKCKAETCSFETRNRILKKNQITLLAPPINTKQTSLDLIVCDYGEFFVPSTRLALDLDVTSIVFTPVPYDYFCPSVKPNLYNVSNKLADRHRKTIHGNDVHGFSQLRVRPVSTATQSASEWVCILQALDGDDDVG